MIALASVALIALQLIPLSPPLWTGMPGRSVLVDGYRSLGEPLPWLPLSMAPAKTFSCALFLLPPIAIIVSVMRLDACRLSWAVGSILAATVLGVVLGYIQVSTRSPQWYLYDITNVGSAVGFFANRDHMGTLLVVSITFVAGVLANAIKRERQESLPILVAGSTSALIVLAGIAMNGSLAAVLLAFPVIVASALLFGRVSGRMRVLGLIAASCVFVVSVALLADSPVEAKLTGTETASITGRQEIWHTSLEAGSAAFPIGTGFGSFEQVYHLYEAPWSVTNSYVNHAHNDFIELFVEGGLPAALLIAGFLFWWFLAARDVWREGGLPMARAASIASAAILGHSLVDFPLRTTAIAAMFAFCIAILAGASRGERERRSIEGQPRHVTIR
jgi:O-antigen ligase